MAKTAIAKTGDQSVAQSIWSYYKDRHPVVRFIIPLSLAGAMLTAGWTVLDHGEYGVALFTVALFVLFGVGAALEFTRFRLVKSIAIVGVLFVGAYSAAVILKARGTKPWTTLGQQSAPSDEPISVSYLYVEKRLRIYNLGNSEIYLYGTKLSDTNRDLGEPRVIAADKYYYLEMERFELMELSSIPEGQDRYVPLMLFIEDKWKRKFTLTCLLWVKARKGQLSVSAQALETKEGWSAAR